MHLKHRYIAILLLTLACGGGSAVQSTTEIQMTRVQIARFSTVTPTVELPSPAASPTRTTPVMSPTLSPTVPPPPASALTSPLATPTLADPAVTQVRPVATLEPAIAAPLATSTPTPVEEAAGLSADQYHLGYGVQLAEAKNMEIAVQGGFTWAKHDLNLRQNINFMSNADNLLNDLHKSGAEHVLLKLIVWSEAGLPDAPRTGDEIEIFAGNAAEVAEFIRTRHGSTFKTIAYEIWNEPNLNYEWEGNPNPVEFVNLLRAASTAIREADPQAIIVSGAPSPGGDYDDLKFLEGMYAGGAKGLMDAVGSHPYGGPWPPDHPTGIDDQGNGYPYFRKPEAQRAIMEKYGDSATQIWATEFSWLAGLPGCNFGEHTPWQVTVEQQADYLVEAYRYAHHHWPWMGPMFVVYDFGLTGRYDRCHPAGGYSILRPDPDSQDIVSPAAKALFAMPKFPGWE